MSSFYDSLMNIQIRELKLTALGRDEAECVVLAWLLKTKLYMIEETSRELSDQAKSMILHETRFIDNLKQ